MIHEPYAPRAIRWLEAAMDRVAVDRAQPNAALLAAEPGTISALGPVW